MDALHDRNVSIPTELILHLKSEEEEEEEEEEERKKERKKEVAVLPSRFERVDTNFVRQFTSYVSIDAQ
jgi:DNA replication protein DnaC